MRASELVGMTGVARPKRLTLEILGPWLLNKGDVLNLWAVASRYEGTFGLGASSRLGLDRMPDEPVMREIRWRPSRREMDGALRSGSVRSRLRHVSGAAALAVNLRPVLRASGIVSGADVDVLLDCSGYAYGDVWSTKRLESRSVHLRKLREHGAKAVMLPQALGPFENEEMRQSATRLFEHYDLIYARDRTSLEHVSQLGLAAPEVLMAPDITHLVPGRPPTDERLWASRVCVVPNARMTDRVPTGVATRYVQFLETCVRNVRASGLEPHLLIHEKNDRELAERIRSATEISAPVIDEDALVSKGILGAAYAVIGSRYHAIISSLSQATPAIGTSWSHKYEELFDDYGCRELVLSPLDAPSQVAEMVTSFLEPGNRADLHERLTGRADMQKERVHEMWGHVEAVMGSTPEERSGDSNSSHA